MLALVVCIAAAALAAPSAEATTPDPAVEVAVAWRARTARLHFSVPDGHHVAPDAPLRATLEVAGVPWSVDTVGASARGGLPVPVPLHRPLLLAGTLEVSVCDDEGTACTVVDVAVQGVLDGARGAGRVLDPASSGPAPAASAAELDAVLAALGDELALLDFGAVWCPPCNLMSAEVLHDPADAGLLEGIQLVEVDVDDHANWALKDRYSVGSYPTLVAVDAAGAEVARRVGYSGEADLQAWLAALSTVEPLSAAPAAEALTPHAAGAWALRLVQGQKGGLAGPYLGVALTADEPVLDAQLATYLLLPTPELALILARAGVPVTTWGWDALDLADERDDVAAAARAAARTALETASGAEAAELFYMLARLAPAAEAPDLYRAGAVALTGALHGDLDRDRGHLGFLSRLWENAGAPHRAAEVLAPALARWPDDMTFHEDRAGLALRTGDTETAVREARAAVAHGYGDNRLRATELLARALLAAGRGDEAVEVVRATLAETPAPAEGLDVRTPRYLDGLRAVAAEAAGDD